MIGVDSYRCNICGAKITRCLMNSSSDLPNKSFFHWLSDIMMIMFISDLAIRNGTWWAGNNDRWKVYVIVCIEFVFA